MMRDEEQKNSVDSRAPPRLGTTAANVAAYLSGQNSVLMGKVRIALAALSAAILAGLSAASASSYLVAGFWPFAVGVAWAAVILNVDTMVVAAVSERAGVGRWLAMAPRLPIVVAASLLFVETITLRIFQPEVEAHLQQGQQRVVAVEREKIETRHQNATDATKRRFEADIARQEGALAELQARITNAAEQRRRAGRDAVQALRDRRVHYNRDGTAFLDSAHSHAARAEEQQLAREGERLRRELAPEFARSRGEVDRLRGEQLAEQTRLDKIRQDDLAALEARPTASGLIARLAALEEICAANSSARWARILLALLLMSVELAPTFAKLGERCEATLIRERMHYLLRRTLERARLQERLALWMEAAAHGYVDAYMKDVNAAMGIATGPLAPQASPVVPVCSDVSADERVGRMIRARASRQQPEGASRQGVNNVQ